MNCRYSKPTGQPWFAENPDGPKTVRCYHPEAKAKKVAGGYARMATVGDTFDPKLPARPQILGDADYVGVRSCLCNSVQCKFYAEPK